MLDVELEEEKYLKKSFLDAWENLALLLVGDIFFCLFCIPFMILFISDLVLPALWLGCFTIAPAFSGLVYLTGKIARGEKFGVKDIVFGIFHFYRRSIVLGSLIALLISFSIATFGMTKANPDQVWLIGSLAIQLAALLLVALLSVYAFSLMAIYDISLKKTLIYAFVLASSYKMPTIGLLSLAVLFAFLMWWTKFGLILVFPVLWAVFSSNLTLLLVQKHQSQRGQRHFINGK